MNEDMIDGMRRWLKGRGFVVGPRRSDEEIVATLWQEVCEEMRLHPNGAPKFDDDGVLLDQNGNRSIFDDVDA